jgi:ABC-type transporter Mla maintaining outer membrane lipid asymmetry ATPase subunit MlaF
MPLGRWPANGRHPLIALQQAAVNLSAHNLGHDSILAVNGPPGTGKTTLLRDIVAHVVTERAKIMATFNDPEDAFENTNLRIKRETRFYGFIS